MQFFNFPFTLTFNGDNLTTTFFSRRLGVPPLQLKLLNSGTEELIGNIPLTDVLWDILWACLKMQGLWQWVLLENTTLSMWCLWKFLPTRTFETSLCTCFFPARFFSQIGAVLFWSKHCLRGTRGDQYHWTIWRHLFQAGSADEFNAQFLRGSWWE